MTPEQRQTLIHELREFARAYPEDIFTPFTEEELKRHSVIITRASAAAGRHFAPWFLKAAAALAQMDADEGLMRQMLEAFHKKVVWQWRREFGIRTCISCHSTQDVGHQRDCAVAAVLDTLRARLGEVPAQGEEADDERNE